MTRIAPSPLGGVELERSTDRSAERMIDRIGEDAPASAGIPFRAALRKADRAVARREVGDASAPLVPPSATAAPAPAPASGALAHDDAARDARLQSITLTPDARPGSIADVVASSMEEPSAAPRTALTGQARGITARSESRSEPAAKPASETQKPTLQLSSLAPRAQGAKAGGDLGATGGAVLDAPLAGAGVATSSATVAPPSPEGADLQDSPVTAWVAAAVARAIGSFGGAASAAASAASAAHAAAAATAANSAPAATAGIVAPSIGIALSALTPLEQAVHDLIARTADRDSDDPRAAKTAAAPDAASIALHVLTANRMQPAASDVRASASAPMHGAQIAQLPELPTNPSHVHLVLDDGPERMVVTVAVRGSEVRVALRASDDATTAALARNAGSLDHAMRARGLALGELTTERDPRDPRPPRDPEPRERRPPDDEPFVLEEKP